HKLPRINGELIEVPIGASKSGLLPDDCWLPGLGGYNKLTEQNQMAHARRCKELDIEYYWLDAGWFESSRSFGAGKWYDGVGNWFVKRDGFPDGLKTLSRAIKEMGLKFILWFEPERVCPDTKLWREHPEWLLPQQNPPEEQNSLSTLVHNFMLTRNISEARTSSLLNLGNIEARRWFTDHISEMITEYRIDVYRHDFNMDPLSIWRYADAEDRQGITEIHYIEGLYAFWDELLKRHPGLIIDNCASGGRRIDIETMSRSVTLWRSDYCREPIGTQCHTYGLNSYMPGHAGGLEGNKASKYEFRGLLSGGAAICWDLEQENFPDDDARMLIEEVKQLRSLFYGDFWPLTPYSLSKNCWMAWQFDRPDLGSGAVFAFRRSQGAKNTIKLFPKGIKQEGRYEVLFVDTDTKKTFAGKELMEKGLEVNEDDAPASVLITYKLIN
ncbi:MAG: alpha-galactosidase, partial [Candidatus Latescibacteria bacterium]|nr:alpha-galactosidase [Candidatus Latescibacterota bacterium]